MNDLSRRAALKLAAVSVASTGAVGVAGAEHNPKSDHTGPADPGSVDRLLAEWPPRPRLAAYEVIDKYGLPQEATAHKLVWHNNGPWKRTVVTRREIPHDFPKLHMDYVQQTIEYKVPADKTDELVIFDGSVTVDRTAGELSSRCNMEEANFLTINLVHDILTGKKSVAEARKAFGDNEVEFGLAKDPPYMKAFQFEVVKQKAADPDVPVVPGSSKRVTGGDASLTSGEAKRDAEILGFVIAINEGEIHAAAVAAKKKLGPPVGKFARMLHEHHGKNLEATTRLAQQIGVTPLETPAVDQFRVESAGHLAELVRLPAGAFPAAYVAQIVKGHTKVLDTIDKQFLKAAENEDLKKHLTATRDEVAGHLAEAKRLQGSLKQ